MVAARGLRLEGTTVLQPLMAQLVKPGRTEVKALGGGEGIQPTVVEGGEDFLDVERRNAAG
jgi:hypothetical protein